MSYNNGYIQAPVSIADVARAVPVTLKRTNSSTGQTERRSSRDLGVLCGASVGDTITASDGKGNWTVESRFEINKWAKYKPVRLGKISTVDEWNAASNFWKNDATWYLGEKSRGELCGMSFGYTSQIPLTDMEGSTTSLYPKADTFFDKIIQGDLHWTYRRPAGGAATPYRLTDFAGYQHISVCPLPRTTTRNVQVTVSLTYAVELDLTDESTLGNLELTDLKPNINNAKWSDLSQMYVGVLFWHTDGGAGCFWKTAAYPLSSLTSTDPVERSKCLKVSIAGTDKDSGNTTLEQLINAFTIKTWYTRAFLCTKQLGFRETFDAYATDGPYYAVACDEAVTTIVFASGSVSVSSMRASYIKAQRKLDVSVDVVNATSSSITLKNIIIHIVDQSDGQDVYTQNVADTTVGIGATVAIDVTFNSPMLIADTQYYARITANYTIGSSDRTIDESVQVITKA